MPPNMPRTVWPPIRGPFLAAESLPQVAPRFRDGTRNDLRCTKRLSSFGEHLCDENLYPAEGQARDQSNRTRLSAVH